MSYIVHAKVSRHPEYIHEPTTSILILRRRQFCLSFKSDPPYVATEFCAVENGVLCLLSTFCFLSSLWNFSFIIQKQQARKTKKELVWQVRNSAASCCKERKVRSSLADDLAKAVESFSVIQRILSNCSWPTWGKGWSAPNVARCWRPWGLTLTALMCGTLTRSSCQPLCKTLSIRLVRELIVKILTCFVSPLLFLSRSQDGRKDVSTAQVVSRGLEPLISWAAVALTTLFTWSRAKLTRLICPSPSFNGSRPR